MSYCVSTWDMDLQRFTPEYEGLSKWELRRALRELKDLGWVEDFSILVEREAEPAEAAL